MDMTPEEREEFIKNERAFWKDKIDANEAKIKIDLQKLNIAQFNKSFYQIESYTIKIAAMMSFPSKWITWSEYIGTFEMILN